MKTHKELEKFSDEGGYMMVEVLVVVSIIVVSILAALTVAQKSIYLARQSLHQSQAAFLLGEGAEVTRIVRDNSWATVSSLNLSTDYYLSFSGGVWSFSTTPYVVGNFTRKIVFSSVYRDGSQNIAPSGTLDSQTRLVTVLVSWVDGNQTLSKTLKFYLTDIFS